MVELMSYLCKKSIMKIDLNIYKAERITTEVCCIDIRSMYLDS